MVTILCFTLAGAAVGGVAGYLIGVIRCSKTMLRELQQLQRLIPSGSAGIGTGGSSAAGS